jgi:hypothetical protein
MRKLADDSSETSISHRMRSQRFARFERLAAGLPRPLSIIDIGGTNEFWEQRGWADREGVTITTVNLTAQERRFDNVIPTVGDATDLSNFADGEFDLAFSNSVIEHLFTFESQQRMAAEVSRVASAYWVQTPNFWFPMEPHFLMPAWHWMPVSLRIAILRRRGVGWMGRCPDPADARRAVEEVRLMRRRELARLFPEAELIPERFGGLVKSWTAIRGLGPATA